MTSDNATPGKAATFVLVPGYWLGAWAWDAVAAELRAAGHDVHAVTPAGQAERAEESAPGADVETQIADLVRLIEDADIREVVLVAHSGANMAVTGAADRIPERIANVVYVDSGPMPSGMAASTSTTPGARRAGEGGRRAGRRMAHPGAAVRRRRRPGQPRGPHRGAPGRHARARHAPAVRHRDAGAHPPRPAAATPRTLIATTIPLDAVRQMGDSGHPVFSLMTGPGWTYRELPTGHWPMLSAPRELAALLAASPPAAPEALTSPQPHGRFLLPAHVDHSGRVEDTLRKSRGHGGRARSAR